VIDAENEIAQAKANAELPDDLAGLVDDARLDAKAFREHTVYDSDGDPIRLGANADRLDQYADTITALSSQLERLRHENDCLQATLAQIDYPCSPHCHGYLREQQLARQLAEREAAIARFNEAYLEAMAERDAKVARLREATAHYDTALLLAFPHGAGGGVFDAWNAARRALENGHG